MDYIYIPEQYLNIFIKVFQAEGAGELIKSNNYYSYDQLPWLQSSIYFAKPENGFIPVRSTNMERMKNVWNANLKKWADEKASEEKSADESGD